MAKRGENIRKRKDGRWEGRYIKGRKSDRTAIWGDIYGHSYNEVKEKLTIKKMEVQQFALNVENPTFFRAFSHLGKLHFLGVKTSTSAHYHYTLQHYILPVLGPYRVQALNESILENSILEIIAPADQNHKTLGNAMSKECLTLVRRICRYAVHLHIIADDIIVFVHLGDSPFFFCGAGRFHRTYSGLQREYASQTTSLLPSRQSAPCRHHGIDSVPQCVCLSLSCCR